MLKVISKQEYRRATWKNGLGYTDEIAIHPPGADLRRGDFLWRVSSAHIAQASPFSMFPDHDRVLVVLKGAGVKLTHTFVENEEESVELPALEPYEFPGDIASRCELLQGPITDLSVFVRKAEVEALTEVAEVIPGQLFAWQPSGRWNFAFAVKGYFKTQGQGFGEGDTLQAVSEEPLPPIEILGAGKLVLVSLQG